MASVSPQDTAIENILFCNAVGYTNAGAEGEPEKTRERAVQAAKYLAKKKASLLVLGEEQLLEGFDFHRDADGEFFQHANEGVRELQDLGNGLYGVQLSGVITYSSPVPAQFSVGAAQALSVTLSSEKEIYREGEALKLHLKGNRDFYGCLLNVTPDGKVLQLLPNGNRKVARFKGGVKHKFPDPFKGDNFLLEVNPPYGKETIYLLASDQAFSGLPGVDDGGYFLSTNDSIDVIKHGIKSLLLKDIIEQEGVGSFGCRHLVIRKIVVVTEGV